MRHRREAALLLSKAQASMRRMARIFNDLDEDGRKTSVLLHLQHAFEMLLKAGLIQEGQAVFDKRVGRSIGFESCVNRSREHLNVTAEEAGLLKAIDALRDEAQHWLTDVPEAILYAHCRGAITLYDRILEQTFQQKLADSLPSRVLPLSTEPPRDIQMLIDDQYSQVQDLLQPGKRRGAEARAGIRTLLALEAHVALEEDDGPRVSEEGRRSSRAGCPRGAGAGSGLSSPDDARYRGYGRGPRGGGPLREIRRDACYLRRP